jgi:urease accessory protein
MSFDDLLIAHLVSMGVGPFYDGAAHFFASIEEVLPALAVALLGGLRGPQAGRWTAAVLPLAWIAGGLTGLSLSFAAPSPLFSVALLLAPGGLIALDRDLPTSVIVGLAAVLGAWAGLLNGAAMAAAGAGFVAVLGAASSALLVVLLCAAFAASIHAGWPRIVLRVAGSWVAAVALLALGWSLR